MIFGAFEQFIFHEREHLKKGYSDDFRLNTIFTTNF